MHNKKVILVVLFFVSILLAILLYFYPVRAKPIKANYIEIGPPFQIIKSSHDSGEVFKLFSKIPLIWKLKRDEYEITLVQGDRWFPDLYVIAKDLNQQRLNVISEGKFLSLKKDYPQKEYQGVKVDYFLRTPLLDEIYKFPRLGKEIIEIEIQTQNGEILGKEMIDISLAYGTHISIDSI